MLSKKAALVFPAPFFSFCQEIEVKVNVFHTALNLAMLVTGGLFMLLPRSPSVGVNVQCGPHHKGIARIKMLTAYAYCGTSIGNDALNNASQCTDLYIMVQYSGFLE